VALAGAVLRPVRSWILDGFPRTAAQALALDAILAQAGVALDRVVTLRIRRRDRGAAGGATAEPGHGARVLRGVRPTRARRPRRLAIYHATAGPLARYYRERDLLADVDASGSIEAVADEILAALPRPVAAG
jgi:adenylate kinase